MLKDWNGLEKPEAQELDERLKAARAKLAVQQMQIKEHKLPVFVLFEGWGAAGKGSVLGKVILNIDPRFFKVFTMDIPTEEEKRKPFLYRYFVKIPEAGKFCFLDSGWMDEITRDCLHEDLSDKEYKKRIDSVKRFERQLTDNGYLVMKFFFHISQKEQQKRLKGLEEDENTSWRVSENDMWQNMHYEKCLKEYDRVLVHTDTAKAPWTVVEATDKQYAACKIITTMVEKMERAVREVEESLSIEADNKAADKKGAGDHGTMPDVERFRNGVLQGIDLSKTMEQEEYKKKKKELQKRLLALHNKMYLKRVPVILAFEGWDAGGKGGAIKRLTQAMDPRGYEVVPVAAPNDIEKAHHYLWRFWERIPKAGHMAIFDRTWYGRGLVERIEGFARGQEWSRAYSEINNMEEQFTNAGYIVLKFWLHIDKEEQERRFRERENTPEKQWKITDEDWRNRAKWDLYEKAVDEMIVRTSTEDAPWIVVEANSKYYARIKVLETVVAALEKRL